MYCANCGAKLPDDAVFCGECGARQNETNSRPAEEESWREQLERHEEYQPPKYDTEPKPVYEQKRQKPPKPQSPHVQQQESSKPQKQRRQRESSTSNKRGLTVGLLAGVGVLAVAAAVFFGIRLLRGDKPTDQQGGSATATATLPANSTPADSIKPEQTQTEQPTGKESEPLETSTDEPTETEGSIVGIGEMEAAIHGTWLGAPDSDGVHMVLFVGLRECAVGIAVPFDSADAGADNFPDGFDVRAFTWYDWRMDGADFSFIDYEDEEWPMAVEMASADELDLTGENGTEHFQRAADAELAPLPWYLMGGWVSEEADSDGFYVAMQFDMEGTNYCEMWLPYVEDPPVVFGDWTYNDWEHSERTVGSFELNDNTLYIALDGGLELEHRVKIVDPWTMELSRDEGYDIFRRMEWLPEM